jgi:hypothetical protein
MNAKRWLNGAAVAATLTLAAHQATAATTSIDPEKLPKVNCSELVYNHTFLAKYPKAPAACEEARVYHGVRYAKFSGKVSSNTPEALTVQFFNVAGDPLSLISLKPSASAKVVVSGETKTFADLKQGDPVTFWVSEKRYAFVTNPASKTSMPIVEPKS